MEPRSIFWKNIVGFEGFYQVSNIGSVRSLDRTVKYKDGIIVPYKGQPLSPRDNGKGYKYISLTKNNKPHRFYIHRLVATYFIPNPLNRKEINHIDGNKGNNCVENLEWCTRSENNKHAYAHNGRISTFAGKSGALSHRSRPIIAINLITSEERLFETQTLASKVLKLNPTTVNRVLKGKCKKNGDYTFSYVQGT